MKLITMAAAVLALTLTGCATMESGASFDESIAQSFREGVATRADVEAALGQPYQVTSNADGSSTLSYVHMTSSANAFGSSEAQGSTAVFMFNGDSVLQSKAIGHPTARSR